MGIRETQIQGLSAAARALVAGKRILLYGESIVRTFPDGRVEDLGEHDVFGSDVKKEKSGETFHGMFPEEETYPLYRYTFPDGHVFEEAVQAEPWSSGPVIFLALKNENGEWVEESLWLQEEIDNA